MDGLEIETVEVGMDASGKVSIPVPQGMAPTPAPVAAVPTFEPGNFVKDLAAMQAAEAQTQPNPEPVAPQPETTKAPATAPATEVPDKFKNPDGTVSQEKIEKSTVNAEEAYQKYADIERKLRQKQNEVAALKQGAPVPATPASVPANVQLSPLEIQVAQDLINGAAELGEKMSQAQAIATARVQVRLMEAKHSAEIAMTESLRERLDSQDRKAELEKIAEQDPWVISPEGVEALGKIRESYPHVNSSTHPWTAAYDQHLANQVKQQRLSGQVPTPTPTARTARPPATPVQAAPRVVVKPAAPSMAGWSSDQISRYVDSLPKKEQDEFYAKQGIRLGQF